MPRTVGYPNPDFLNDTDLVRVARARFDHGRTYRQENREDAWRQSEIQFRGNHWESVGASPAQDPTADLVVVNISFSTVTTIVPYVTGSDPRFLVEPYSANASIRNARAQAAWLNRFWRTKQSGARRAVSRAAHDHIIYGDGWGKITYEITKNEWDQDLAEVSVDAISPWDVWVDPLSDGLHNARWVAQRIRMTVGELRADDRYSNTAEVEVGVWGEADDEADARRIAAIPATNEGEENDNEWVDIIEFWDLSNRRMIAFARGGERPLRAIEDAECPIVQLDNHWLPKSPYHIGDLEQIWSLQQELNKSRSQMLTHRRRNIGKYLVKSDVLDSAAESALTSEVVGAVVKIKGDLPLDNIIRPVASLPLSADAYNVSDLITRDVFEITGVNEYLRGATPEIRRTATEASIIEGASNVKSAHKLGKIEGFVRELGTLVLDVARDVFPQTDADELEIYITGRDAEALNRAEIGERLSGLIDQGADPDIVQREAQGADLYGGVKLRLGEDIFEGVYQVEVVRNSTELRNPIFKEQKHRDMAESLTQVAPVLAEQGVIINLRKVYELWFEAAGVQDIDDMFLAAPDAGLPQGPQPQGEDVPGSLQGLGDPNLAAARPPDELLTALNTGALPPTA